MDPLTVSVSIARPREEVFAFLEDIANHALFTDHYLTDWHMTRVDTVGRGAGARFRVKVPGQRFTQADATLIEVDPPRRIVEGGRSGKYNRVRTRGVYELDPGPGGTTRVSFTLETRSDKPVDRILESFGARRWWKRKNTKALKRLRSILEEGKGAGRRPTIAGLDR
jgi:uncharacterized protein YndB with AHSA1/START domain